MSEDEAKDLYVAFAHLGAATAAVAGYEVCSAQLASQSRYQARVAFSAR